MIRSLFRRGLTKKGTHLHPRESRVNRRTWFISETRAPGNSCKVTRAPSSISLFFVRASDVFTRCSCQFVDVEIFIRLSKDFVDVPPVFSVEYFWVFTMGCRHNNNTFSIATLRFLANDPRCNSTPANLTTTPACARLNASTQWFTEGTAGGSLMETNALITPRSRPGLVRRKTQKLSHRLPELKTPARTKNLINREQVTSCGINQRFFVKVHTRTKFFNIRNARRAFFCGERERDKRSRPTRFAGKTCCTGRWIETCSREWTPFISCEEERESL